jgi:hypothetical protein
MNKWDEIKEKGNPAYKAEIEPIDLFKEGEILWNWCIGEIIAKAYRSRLNQFTNATPVETCIRINRDMNEIIHHAEMIKAIVDEAKREELTDEVF